MGEGIKMGSSAGIKVLDEFGNRIKTKKVHFTGAASPLTLDIPPNITRNSVAPSMVTIHGDTYFSQHGDFNLYKRDKEGVYTEVPKPYDGSGLHSIFKFNNELHLVGGIYPYTKHWVLRDNAWLSLSDLPYSIESYCRAFWELGGALYTIVSTPNGPRLSMYTPDQWAIVLDVTPPEVRYVFYYDGCFCVGGANNLYKLSGGVFTQFGTMISRSGDYDCAFPFVLDGQLYYLSTRSSNSAYDIYAYRDLAFSKYVSTEGGYVQLGYVKAFEVKENHTVETLSIYNPNNSYSVNHGRYKVYEYKLKEVE